jgi:NitT/TauT family transport system ATP-binding protein
VSQAALRSVAGATAVEADAPAEAAPSSAASSVHARLRGVTRVYPAGPGAQPVHALGPIDLDLRRGEFFSVVGPSGCGKSTLLDVLGGLAVASAGSVEFEGRPVAGEVPDGVGIVFQEDASFPWLSVYDNAAFGLRRAGMDEAQIRERVEHALSFMGLRGFTHSYPAQLSGGMRQRLCIARTLVTRPRLLLLDEPFGALDQQTRLLMGDELLKLWRDTGATILLITHALDEAAMLSDRVGVMSARPGVFLDVVETGWPQERDSNIVSEDSFGRITGRLWSTLRAESQKSMASGQAAPPR